MQFEMVDIQRQPYHVVTGILCALTLDMQRTSANTKNFWVMCVVVSA